MADVLAEVDYAEWLEGSIPSARAIVPHLVDAVAPASVADVGCGLGAWLAAFREAGVDDVLGVDGGWVDTSLLLVPAGRFVAADLREPLEIGRRFDLALCLEVAQILDPASARTLVASLAGLADVVAFSAAIPGQGGIGHLNEQWPSYWARLFAERGFVASDPIRRSVWQAEGVKWWFAQNLVCFARPGAVERLPRLRAALCDEGEPLPLVHPGCLAAVVESHAHPALSEGRLRSLVRRARG